MKFTCKKSELQDVISTVQKAITGKTTLPILSGIMINVQSDKVVLTGSDIDLSIESEIEAEIIEEGSVVVDAKILSDIIKKLPNSTVSINTVENNSIEILCQKSKFTLVYMNPEDFPSIPSVNEGTSISILQKTLKNMIRQTIFAIAQDNTRPILTGVLFELGNNQLNLVALDGYRLSLKSEVLEDIDTKVSLVIPGKALNELGKILKDGEEKVDIIFSTNYILFNLDKTKIISRLLEGAFIRYQSIMPTENTIFVETKKTELLHCIERASVMSNESSTSLIKLDIKESGLTITSNSQLGKVKEELDISLKGEPLEIAFNAKYLMDALKIMDEDDIIMEFSGSVSPCIIKNKNTDNYTYLALPVRLINK